MEAIRERKELGGFEDPKSSATSTGAAASREPRLAVDQSKDKPWSFGSNDIVEKAGLVGLNLEKFLESAGLVEFHAKLTEAGWNEVGFLVDTALQQHKLVATRGTEP